VARQARRSGHRFLKRILDIGMAIPGLVLVTLILLIAMALVRLNSPGSCCFVRFALDKTALLSSCWKLRTMCIDKDDSAVREFNTRELLGASSLSESGIFKLSNDHRILPIGYFLRRYSIDELPQLVNVFRGEMSIVDHRLALLGKSRSSRLR